MDDREKSFDDVCMCTDTCALAGAAAFFAGIKDAVIVVNGPLWCHFFAMRHIEHSQATISHRMLCTQLDNDAIVFGAEEYLNEALAPYVEQPPALLAIISSCAAGLIGDDVEAIARGAGITCPIVALDTSGLTGSFADGWDKAACTALPLLLAGRQETQAHTVNLIGMTSTYCNGGNDVCELVRLLEMAGYHVNAVLGSNLSAAGMGTLSRAALNIVVHDELGLGSACLLNELCGTPYLEMLPPYGRAGTRHWLQEIARVLPPLHGDTAEAEIARVMREDFLRINECKSLWGELCYETALIRAPRSVAWGLAQALRTEWADVCHLVVAADTAGAREALPLADEILGETDAVRIRELLAEMEDGLLLGSSNESAHIDPRGTQYLPVAYPVQDALCLSESPFMGLRGARHIEELLWNGNILRRKQMIR